MEPRTPAGGELPTLKLTCPAVSLPEIETVPPPPTAVPAAMVGLGPWVDTCEIVSGPDRLRLRTDRLEALSELKLPAPLTLRLPLTVAREFTVRVFCRVVAPLTMRFEPTLRPVAAVLPVIL